MQLYIDLLFTTIPILVYKNLRKVLQFVYGFSEILKDMPGCVVDFRYDKKEKAAGKAAIVCEL